MQEIRVDLHAASVEESGEPRSGMLVTRSPAKSTEASPRSSRKIPRAFLAASLFVAASSLASCLPLALGSFLWPHGLSGGAEYIFWLASGVNLAGVLLLGSRYAPVILLSALPAIFLLGEPVERSVLGAAGNCLEAFLAAGLLRSSGRFTRRFDHLRAVLALMLASFIGPLAGSLAVPAWLVSSGRFTPREFWAAVGNWNLANGVAILILTPFLLALARRQWNFTARRPEPWIWLLAGSLIGLLGFDAVFQARGFNFAFLIFPFVILVAVRYGPEETAAALTLMMIAIYIALIRNAPSLSPSAAPAILWFLQAFSWVAAATALLVSVLVEERRRAERNIATEKQRILEASLREERARLEALRYQIHPHFLFNALNSVRSALPLDATTPRNMVTELSAFLRTHLDRQEGDQIPLREELEAAERYLAIEKIRYGDDLVLRIDASEEASRQLVPVFLLQPLLENAVRHGFRPGHRTLEIHIDAFVRAPGLVVEVRSSGPWRAPGSGHGLGLANVRRRLALIHGERAALDILKGENSVSVRITLPANPHGPTAPCAA